MHLQKKLKPLILTLTALASLLHNPCAIAQTDVETTARARAVMMDNEIERDAKGLGRDANFFCNPLTLNGVPLDYSAFSIDSKGMLAVMEGNPESMEAQAVPFRVFLRRNGQVLDKQKTESQQPVFQVELSDIMALAMLGDDLIVVPARRTDWKAKRILKIRSDR